MQKFPKSLPCLGLTMAAFCCNWQISVQAQGPVYRPPFQPPLYQPPSFQPVPRAAILPASPPSMMRMTAQPVAQPISTHQSLQQLATTHPFCFVVGEALASAYLCSTTVDEGPFQDFVMGAQVNGVQKTNAKTSIDFTPDPRSARMLFVLKGVSENKSVAQVPQAAIHTSGVLEFELTKQVEFNGQSIRTWSPSAFMKVQQKNLGASTAVSGVPVLGPLANNIVLNAAEQRKEMSKKITALRVTDQVAPKFNFRLDQELAKLNASLNGPVKEKLVQKQIYPSRVSALTTDDALLCGLDFCSTPATANATKMQRAVSGSGKPRMLMTRHLIAGPSPQYGAEVGMVAPEPYSLDSKTLRDRACLLIHASLIEDLASRYQLAGKEISDTQLQALLSGKLPTVNDQSSPNLYSVIMAEENPVTAMVDGGELLITLRVGIRPVIGPKLPAQRIEIAVEPKLTDSQVIFKPEVRSIEPVDPAADTLGGAGATLIRQAIEQRLQEVTISRNYNLPRENDTTCFPVRLQNLTLVDGWITAVFEQAGGTQSASLNPDEAIDVKLVR